MTTAHARLILAERKKLHMAEILTGREEIARAMQGANALRMLQDQPWDQIAEQERDHWLFLADAILALTPAIAADAGAPSGSGAGGMREAKSVLTEIAAECHRAKWEFDLSDDYRPTPAVARSLITKGFAELHRIGDRALKLRDALKTATAPQGQEVDREDLAQFLCSEIALEPFDELSRQKYLGDADAILKFIVATAPQGQEDDSELPTAEDVKGILGPARPADAPAVTLREAFEAGFAAYWGPQGPDEVDSFIVDMNEAWEEYHAALPASARVDPERS
jgi:hypothetical protein